MKGIIFLTGLIVCISSGFVLADNIITGSKPDELPSPNQCGACHMNQGTYNELIQSSHEDLSCFDCHLPGVVQKLKYERQNCSFSRLGYHIEADKWRETSGDEVCLRCHEGQMTGNVSDKCWSCHMPVTGVDELVFLKDKKQPPSKDNIREVKKMPHRSHLFRFHQAE
jgi:nitrate/TMAO reductase-like tetraheme cytochrome c subunit